MPNALPPSPIQEKNGFRINGSRLAKNNQSELLLVDGVFQAFAGAEFWLHRSGDFDFLAGAWVAAFGCGALGGQEGAKTNETDIAAFFQGFADYFQCRIERTG